MSKPSYKLLRRQITWVFKATGCMDLYGSNDYQRLQVIRTVLIDEKRHNEKVAKLLDKIGALE